MGLITLEPIGGSRLDTLYEQAVMSYAIEKDKNLIISYSGGKDSTVLLLAACEAIKRGYIDHSRVSVIFADTMLEVPALINQIDKLLGFVEEKYGINIIRVKRDPSRGY